MAGKKTLNSSWKRQLSESLNHLALTVNSKVAIIGVGAELNGDDAVGILAVRKLKPKLSARQNLLVLEGGSLPENLTGPLRRFSPELVMFIDAAELFEPPGTIRVLEPGQVTGASFSSHRMPLTLVFDYLTHEVKSKGLLIGVQPEVVEFGLPPSASGKRAVADVVREITHLFNPDETDNLRP